MSDALIHADALEELYELADEVIETLQSAGGLVVPPEKTIYSQCGKKPHWPYWARHPFSDMWARL